MNVILLSAVSIALTLSHLEASNPQKDTSPIPPLVISGKTAQELGTANDKFLSEIQKKTQAFAALQRPVHHLLLIGSELQNPDKKVPLLLSDEGVLQTVALAQTSTGDVELKRDGELDEKTEYLIDTYDHKSHGYLAFIPLEAALQKPNTKTDMLSFVYLPISLNKAHSEYEVTLGAQTLPLKSTYCLKTHSKTGLVALGPEYLPGKGKGWASAQHIIDPKKFVSMPETIGHLIEKTERIDGLPALLLEGTGSGNYASRSDYSRSIITIDMEKGIFTTPQAKSFNDLPFCIGALKADNSLLNLFAYLSDYDYFDTPKPIKPQLHTAKTSLLVLLAAASAGTGSGALHKFFALRKVEK